MLKKIKTLLPAALLTITFLAAGQDVEPFNPYGDIMPSVNTYSMIKYGNFTPSLYTGAMSYSVPIYTYKDPDFEIPISLDYNYDGFRPSTYSGEVGLGWMLNVGGVITREVRGVPDEQDKDNIDGYFWTVDERILDNPNYSIMDARYFRPDYSLLFQYTCALLSETPSRYIMHLLDPFSDMPVLGYTPDLTYETTPDLFHFNIMGMTGDFSMFPDGTVKVFNSNIPYGEINVDILFKGVYQHDEGPLIVITTADSTQYIFGVTEHSREYTESVSSINDGSSGYDDCLSISAWKLSKIIAPNKREAVFSYSEGWQGSVSTTPRRKNGAINAVGYDVQLDCIDRSIPNDINHSIQCQAYSPLKSINIDERNVVLFDYLDKSVDECDEDYFNYKNYSRYLFANLPDENKRLSGIRILDSNNEYFQCVTLSQSYASGGTPKMFLDTLSVLGSGKHTFTYYDRDYFPEIDTDYTDHWNYWNNTPKAIPTKETQGLYNQNTHYAPNFERTRAGALRTIVFPTAGMSEIEYEPNDTYWIIDYSKYESPHLITNTDEFAVGGLRVKRITNYSNGKEEYVDYTYQDPDNSMQSSGILTQMPKYLVVENISYRHPGGIYIPSGTYDVQNLPPFQFNYDYYSYTFCSHFNVPRSNYITYKSIQKHNYDGSREETDFYSYLDCPNDYYNKWISSNEWASKYSFRGKHIDGEDDSYIYDDRFDDNRLPVYGLTDPSFCDKACIRGKKKEERVYAADNSLMKKRTYDYDINLIASTDTMWFNNVINFIGVRYDCYNADLRSTTTAVRYPEANNEIVTMEGMDYNGSGQISNKSNTYETASEKIYYQYTHETGQTSPSGLDRLLCDAVKTRLEDGHELLVAAEHYDYGISGNPHPTAITTYVIDSPIQVDPITLFSSLQSSLNGCRTKVSTFTYDSHQRLTHASFPGGAQTDYTWTSDGRYVESKIVNIEGNTTIFEWRDLVGLTKVQDPSGRSESYLYDSRNRLMKRLDSETNTTEEYHYHLENE